MIHEGPALLVEDDGAVRTLRLNRPHVLNAMDDGLLRSLAEGLREADAEDSVRCIVLTGAGRGFCVGADLKEYGDRTRKAAAGELPRPSRTDAMLPLGRWNVLLTTLLELHKPIIAAVNGLTVGGGLALACASDIRIAAESAVFCAIFAERGLSFEAGTSYLLPRLIGLESTFRMVYTAERASARDARDMALVGQVVPDAELSGRVTELAQRIASLPTLQLGMARRQILTSLDVKDPTTAMMLEVQALGVAQHTDDYHEGHNAFFERRSARFTGH